MWKVDVVDSKGAEHEVTVDAQNGKATATKTDDERDDTGGHSSDYDG